ncbi:MAG: tetratricopeptide repeat protein [Candidatus Omnitrophota bacterium]
MKIFKIITCLLVFLLLAINMSYASPNKDYCNKRMGSDYQGIGRESEKLQEVELFYVLVQKHLEPTKNVVVENARTIYLLKGIEHASKGKYDKAIEQFKKALILNPKDALAHNCLGGAYKSKGMLDEAIKAYKKALILNPKDARAHTSLAAVYERKKMRDEAIEEYKKAIAIDPEYFRPHYDLGVAYKCKGMVDEAIEEYKKALVIDPNNAKTHYELALLYCNKKQYDLSIEHCDKAIKYGKKSSMLLKRLAPFRNKDY